jgi:hypothetical protein
VVYFAAIAGAINIGYSSNLDGRMKSLQIGSPDVIRLVAVLPGDRILERRLHKKFSHVRLGGEFFKPGPVLDFLENIVR